MASTPAADFKLAAEFPPATDEQWRKLVDAVLKGASFEQKLVAKTHDGLAIEPLYPRTVDAQPIAGRAPGAPWTVMQRIDHTDPKAANAQALDDLENGATGLALVFAGAAGAHGFGLPAGEEDIACVLDGIHLDAGIAIELELPPFARDVPPRVAEAVKRRGVDPAATTIRFGYDPLTAIATSGAIPFPWSKTAPLMAGLIDPLAKAGFSGPFAAADARAVHNAGGSEAQELAFALAAAVAYLRAFEANGTILDTARGMISFRLIADTDQLLTTAKFRALRKLWARIEETCGLEPKPAFIAAETAWRMMTARDPHVNIVRATIAAFAAGIAGADAVAVLPFTAALGLPDPFARRLARNTQLILMEEAGLAHAADPAAGSGGIEALTDSLCRHSWALFQEIEAAGGAAAALERGLIQDRVAQTRAAREQALSSGRDALVGVTLYPDADQLPVDVLDVPRGPAPSFANAQQIKPLAPMRLAEPFETRQT